MNKICYMFVSLQQKLECKPGRGEGIDGVNCCHCLEWEKHTRQTSIVLQPPAALTALHKLCYSMQILFLQSFQQLLCLDQYKDPHIISIPHVQMSTLRLHLKPCLIFFTHCCFSHPLQFLLVNYFFNLMGDMSNYINLNNVWNNTAHIEK